LVIKNPIEDEYTLPVEDEATLPVEDGEYIMLFDRLFIISSHILTIIFPNPSLIRSLQLYHWLNMQPKNLSVKLILVLTPYWQNQQFHLSHLRHLRRIFEESLDLQNLWSVRIAVT
jgi:hypothetical protein